MKNVKLAAQVINHILDNPETWDQGDWHCETTHCFAGYVQIMGGHPERAETCRQDLIDLLECSREDAIWLIYSGRTLPELHAYVKSYVEGVPYFDADGYDRNRYNRYGYNRYGYDRYGYDCYGYDRHGYNRSGYDRYGYDRRRNRLPRLTAE